MYNLEIEKKQKHKLITIVISMVIVIILLVVAIVAVTTNKSNQAGIIGENENDDFSIITSEPKPEEDTKKEVKTETKVSTVETLSTKTTKTESKLPETGPIDLLPIAVVLGLLTSGATAFAMNKRSK